MIISVYFRGRYRGEDDENDKYALENRMLSNQYTIDAELQDHKINYQAVNLPDNDHVQILCNDPEEREHIKHLLIRMQPVLCFMMEGKIIYGKFPTEFEKEYWEGEREYARKKKKQEEFEHKKRQAKIKKMIDSGEAWIEETPPEHNELWEKASIKFKVLGLKTVLEIVKNSTIRTKRTSLGLKRALSLRRNIFESDLKVSQLKL